MFKKLRNRLIWINFTITTIIITVVFSIIYLTAERSASNRPPMPDKVQVNIENNTNQNNIEQLISVSIAEEKAAASKQLLFTLISAGLAIEIMVVLVSYYLAEEAIKPVKDAYENQKVFLANAAHEIKTPIAAISANLEAADIQNNKWISNIETETQKLTNLNNELLTLARSDLNHEINLVEINLENTLQKYLESFKPRLKKQNLIIKLNYPEKIKINQTDFLKIVSILMDNAIKYSEKQIIIELKPQVLKITNDGKTISRQDLPHIFERFYQSDKSSEGVGLGLSIAKSLAEQNHWQISATSHQNQTTFLLTF